MTNTELFVLQEIERNVEHLSTEEALAFIQLLQRLTPYERMQQVLFNQVITDKFEKAQEIMKVTGMKLKEAQSYDPRDENLTLKEYTAINATFCDDWKAYKFLRKNGYSCEELTVPAEGDTIDLKTLPDFEKVETELLGVQRKSLLWQAAKHLTDADREQVKHIEELQEVVNTAKQFQSRI